MLFTLIGDFVTQAFTLFLADMFGGFVDSFWTMFAGWFGF